MTTFWLSTHLATPAVTRRLLHRRAGPSRSNGTGRRAVQARDRVRPRCRSGRLLARPDPRAPADVAGVLALQPSGACVFHRLRLRPGRGWRRLRHPRDAARLLPPFPVCVRDRPARRARHAVALSARPRRICCSTGTRTVASWKGLPCCRRAGARGPRCARGAAAGRLGTRVGTRPEADGTGHERLALGSRALGARRLASMGVTGARAMPERCSSFERRGRRPCRQRWPGPAPIDDTVRVWQRPVAPAWGQWTTVVGRYLAARAHASWAMCLGNGPADVDARSWRSRRPCCRWKPSARAPTGCSPRSRAAEAGDSTGGPAAAAPRRP